MAHWLFKSEPDVFSFDALAAKGAKARNGPASGIIRPATTCA